MTIALKELSDRYSTMWHALRIANARDTRAPVPMAELAIDQWHTLCEAYMAQEFPHLANRAKEIER